MPDVATEPTPLVEGADHVMRVCGTRITLDTVLAAFQDSATAEEIVQQYPSLSLADMDQVIGHAAALEPYFAQRQEDAQGTRERNESACPPDGIRDRLRARRRS